MAPFKRQRQPKMTTQALLDFDLGESSSDSDFRIDDFDTDNSKDDDDEEGDDNSSATSSSNDEDDDEDDESDKGSEDSTLQLKQLLADASEEIRVDNKDNNNKSKAVTKTPEVTNGGDNLEEMLRKFDSKADKPKLPTKPICCVCLGDRSDDTNEIVECDGCGVSVHEGCYGVSDNTSISSTNSTCSTEPWFCEACRAGVSEPSCELCPNKGGIYKETDVGKWVHLVCALYVPGVAFGEVDQLSNVTLFEMQYSKWGAKVCSLCENSRYSRTGVCIGCDAGMCKTFFHVTCAQAAGFLTEAHHEDTDAADPFYAHCKVHSEKELIRKRKRNYHTFRLHMEQKQQEKKQHKLDEPCPAQMRINRKLQKYQLKYAAHKQSRSEPWVPTQKMSRLLTTSASACRRLLAKANVMDVDVDLLERQEVQVASITDIRKKWHIAPAFSVEFVAYYIDRISRTKELKEDLSSMMARNATLTKDQDSLRKEYDSLLDKNREHKEKHEALLNSITQLQTHITALCPNKNLINPLNVGRPAQQDNLKANTPPARPISVPTAAALKMGVGFPLAHLGHPNTKGDSNRLLSTHVKNSPSLSDTHGSPGMLFSLNNNAIKSPLIAVETHNCGICQKSNDQHLLAKCDTCKLYYHLGCLNPPLTRHPKKSKLYGWQCSECDKSDQSDGVPDLPKGPRKSRTRFNKDGIIVPVKSSQYSDDSMNNSNASKHSLIHGPVKRRSLDIASSSTTTISPTPSSTSASAAKKLNLNKSLPSTLNELSIRVDNCQKSSSSSSGQLTPKLSKKSKLSLNYQSKTTQPLQQQQTNINKDSTNSITNTTQNQFEDSTTHHPPVVQPPLPNDEPLVLMLNSKSSTPLPVSADHDPLTAHNLITNRNATANNINTISALEGGAVVVDNSKQARKQKRKDKHRNKHSLSSDTEKSPNKEHKRKRKKKQHDLEAPNDTMAGIPKIKIKFKTLPLPGEVTPEAQFFYVSADMVRSADEASRPGSVETIEDVPIANYAEESTSIPKQNETTTTPRPSASNKSVTNSPANVVNTPTKRAPSPRKSSPRKSIPPRTSVSHSGTGGSGSAAARSKVTSQNVNQILICCVCQANGATSNAVTCDECRKHYHFTCLDPPLKKTPKIRGYSWHCADCDPTDEEKH